LLFRNFPLSSLLATKGDSHGNDLAEVKERQDQLEAYLSVLESRVDWQETMLRLAGAHKGVRASSGDAAPRSEEESVGQARPGLQPAESLLRSIVLKQSMDSTTLRKVARAQESGQSRLQTGVDRLADQLNSIADTLRRIEGERHDRRS
jgi:hypothetical protein